MSHSETHFKESRALRDFVIGMADGLTVPFALAAGLSGAGIGTRTIVTAGIAEIVAGSIAMGLGGYLAGKTEWEHYHGELNREHYEVEHFPDLEKKEIEEIFSGYGISAKTQESFVNELSINKTKWVDFMMRFELGLERPDPQEAKKSAARIGGSYALGGTLPLLPYLFTSSAHEALIWSSVFTLVCLGIFGFLKGKITRQDGITGALRVTLIGALAAAAAFGIAKLISH